MKQILQPSLSARYRVTTERNGQTEREIEREKEREIVRERE